MLIATAQRGVHRTPGWSERQPQLSQRGKTFQEQTRPGRSSVCSCGFSRPAWDAANLKTHKHTHKQQQKKTENVTAIVSDRDTADVNKKKAIVLKTLMGCYLYSDWMPGCGLMRWTRTHTSHRQRPFRQTKIEFRGLCWEMLARDYSMTQIPSKLHLCIWFPVFGAAITT